MTVSPLQEDTKRLPSITTFEVVEPPGARVPRVRDAGLDDNPAAVSSITARTNFLLLLLCLHDLGARRAGIVGRDLHFITFSRYGRQPLCPFSVREREPKAAEKDQLR